MFIEKVNENPNTKNTIKNNIINNANIAKKTCDGKFILFRFFINEKVNSNIAISCKKITNLK